jgi:hypothetical protein
MPGCVTACPRRRMVAVNCAWVQLRPVVRSGSSVQTKSSSFGTIYLDDNPILNNDDNLAIAQPAKRVTNRFERLVVQGESIATRGCDCRVQLRTGHG